MACLRVFFISIVAIIILYPTDAGGLWFKKTFNWMNPYCMVNECCFKHFTPDIPKLEMTFQNHLFGQRLARDTVLGAIYGHVNNPHPKKALVLSLHGPPGTGKNHISHLVAESLYAYGTRSSFVTEKMSTKDYAHVSELDQYKREIVEMITSKIANCPHQLFIFDEIENMPAGLLDSIKAFLDYHEYIDGVDFRKAIFIFRSNLGGTEINKYISDQYAVGTQRDDIELQDIEKILTNSVFNREDAGLYRAKIVGAHLVSHFVPFLPLEASHVRRCIQVEFSKFHSVSNRETENKVLEKLQFDGPGGLFAVKGCKNVAEKVSIILYQQQRDKFLSREEL